MSSVKLTAEQLRAEQRITLNNIERVQAIAASIVNKAQGIVGSWDGPARIAAQKSIAEIADGLNKVSANQIVIADWLGKLASERQGIV